MITANLAVTNTFQRLSALLEAAGQPTASQDSKTSQDGYIKNLSTTINLLVGTGTASPTYYATVNTQDALVVEAGANTNNVWLKSASSTLTAEFGEGVIYSPAQISGVIGAVTATEDQIPKADAEGDLVASGLASDGSTLTLTTQDFVAEGTLTSSDATTPALILSTGSTNTGYIDLFGKTSGKRRFTTADATAQTVTDTVAAQTVGGGTITTPDLAGASTAPVFTTIAQTLTNKTLTAPIIVTGGKIVDAGGDEYVVFTEAATPVTYIGITSGNTTVAPQIRGAGEANTSLLLAGTGTGNVTIGDGADVTKLLSVELVGATTGTATTLAVSQTDARTITLPDATGTVALTSNLPPFTAASASDSAKLAFAEDTDNGAHAVTLKAPAAVTADVDVVLPDAAGTVMLTNEVLRSYLASTVTYNNVDTLADTALSVTVAASGIYDIELVVHSTNAVAALNMDFGGTATIINFVGRWQAQGDGEGFATYGATVTAAGTDFGPSAFDGAVNPFYTFQGSVEINGAGTFLLRGAQNAANASNTTILRGSTLVLTKMN